MHITSYDTRPKQRQVASADASCHVEKASKSLSRSYLGAAWQDEGSGVIRVTARRSDAGLVE